LEDGGNQLEFFSGLFEVGVLTHSLECVLIDDLLDLISVDGLSLQLTVLLVSNGGEGIEDLLEI